MIELTPNLIELRFKTFGFFDEFVLKNSSLNTFAFSRVIGSPVSWHLALKISACNSSSKIASTGLFWKIKGCFGSDSIIESSFFSLIECADFVFAIIPVFYKKIKVL